MPIQERAPRIQRRELTQPSEATIASRVAYVVDNLKRDRQAIPNPHELCKRADMAMVATLQIVAAVLPEAVREQVNQLISIQREVYNAAVPPQPTPLQEHEQGTSPRPSNPIR
jgi:hypothetical protein